MDELLAAKFSQREWDLVHQCGLAYARESEMVDLQTRYY